MKKLYLYVFLLLIFCNVGFAKNYKYICNLDTQFINKEDDKWINKNMKLTFSSNNNETISIFDHEIDLSYSKKLDVMIDDDQILAVSFEENSIDILVIDRLNDTATYSLSYIDGYNHGQYGFGKCTNLR
jgi:hypothetical protein